MDAIVVGSDRAQLGLLLFVTDDDLVESLAPLLAKANAGSPSFAQISPDMCAVVSSPERIAAIPKSSKGTIQRGVANEVFKAEIDSLYAAASGQDLPRRNLADIQQWLRMAVKQVAKSDAELLDDTDLFNWGVDSVKATRLRSAMQKVG